MITNSSKKYKDLIRKIENLKYLEENREYFLGNILILKELVEDRFASEKPIIENEGTTKIYENALKGIEELVNYTEESKSTYTIGFKQLKKELPNNCS